MELKDGFVTKTIETYRNVFGNNLLLYHFSFFKQNPLAVLRSIEHFLGLPPYYNEQNFDNSVINAGSRRNVSLISYILSREKLILALGAVFPRKLLQYLRNSFDKLSSKDKRGSNNNVYTTENLQISKDFFAEEDMRITALFDKCSVQLGSGTLFDYFFE
jgi:hypothetical protein